MTANQAFTRGGILPKMGRSCLEECSTQERELALETLALFAAMEISALLVLSRDRGEPDPHLFLAGSPSPLIETRVAALLGRDVKLLGRCEAAKGCAWVGADIFSGAESILGLKVDLAAKLEDGKAWSP